MNTQDLSRFMRKTLLPEEKVLQEARYHGIYIFYAFLALAFWIVVGWGLQYLNYKTFSHQISWMPVLFGLGVGVWIWFWMLLKMWTTEIVLTDKRLIHKRGFFMIELDEVDIEQLASDNVAQSLLGRLLDFGAVHIRCIEANDFWLPPIAGPYEFRNAVEKQKGVYRERYLHVEHLRRHGNAPGDSR